MKIDLKLSPDQINTVAIILQQVYNTRPTEKQQKIMHSIAQDITDIFCKKNFAIRKKNNLFEAKQSHKIALKIHEVDVLQRILERAIDDLEDIYTITILEKLIATMDQKLA